jgi:hypothetical protein
MKISWLHDMRQETARQVHPFDKKAPLSPMLYLRLDFTSSV